MEIKRIDFRGIQRDVSPLMAPEGSCRDMVNLRPKDGALRPVPRPQVIYTGEGGKMLIGLIKLYAHSVLPAGHYIAHTRHEHAGTGNLIGNIVHTYLQDGNWQIGQVLKTWTEAPPGAFDYDLNMDFFVPHKDVLLSLTAFGRSLVISVEGKTTVHLYDSGAYRINASVTDLKDIDVSGITHDHKDLSGDIGSHDSYAEARSSYFQNLDTQREAKRYDGVLFAIAAYRMADGTTVKTSQPFMITMGREDGQLDNRSVAFTAESVDIQGVHVSKAKIRVKTAIPYYWKQVISSVDLYVSRDSIYISPEEVGPATGYTFERKAPEDVFKNMLFYKAESIDLENFIDAPGDTITVEKDLDIDLDNIETSERLEVDPQTHHDITYKATLTFNGRLHGGDISQHLFGGHGIHVPEIEWMATENAAMYDAYDNIVPYPTNQDVFAILYYIKTDDGERVIKKELPPGALVFEQGGEKKLLLPSVIIYPHIKATHFKIVLQTQKYIEGGGQVAKVIFQGELTRHNFYGFCYHLPFQSALSEEPVDDYIHRLIMMCQVEFPKDPGPTQNMDVDAKAHVQGMMGTEESFLLQIDTSSAGLHAALQAYRSTFNGVQRPFDMHLESGFDLQYIEDNEHQWGDTEVYQFKLSYRTNALLDYSGETSKIWGTGETTHAININWTSNTYEQVSNKSVNSGVVSLPPPPKPIVSPGRIQLTGLENPFIHPPRHSYLAGDDNENTVMALEVQASPTSEGQFGQYPLVALTQQGIYLLDQGKGDVLYSAGRMVSHISADKSAIGLEGVIMFTSQKRLYLLEGRTVREMTRKIAETSTFSTQADNNPISEDPEGFLDEVIFGYDYVNAEIIIINPLKDYHYRYSLKVDVFFAVYHLLYTTGENDIVMRYKGLVIQKGHTQALNTIPGANTTMIEVYDIAAGQDEPVRVFIKTNPLTLGTPQFKKLMRTILYVDATTPDNTGYLEMFLYGGNRPERAELPLLQESKMIDDKAVMYLAAGRINLSIRYIVLELSGLIDPEAVVHFADTEVLASMPGKIR